jgi:transcriptional regulator with XRE-family HTH domain
MADALGGHHDVGRAAGRAGGGAGVGHAEGLSLIGRRLRALRKGNNLSQREVAEAMGLPQSNLSRIENGKQRLNLGVLAGMLSIYHTTIQEFFAHEGEIGRTGGALTLRERQIVESFRRLGPDDRRELEGYLDYKLFRARRDSPSRPEGLD